MSSIAATSSAAPDEGRPRILVIGKPAADDTENPELTNRNEWLQWTHRSGINRTHPGEFNIQDYDLLCLGQSLALEEAEQLALTLAECPRPPKLIIHATKMNQAPEVLRPFLNYFSPRALSHQQLLSLITSLLNHDYRPHPLNDGQQQQTQRLLERLNSCEDWLDGIAILVTGIRFMLPCDAAQGLVWQTAGEDDQAISGDVILCADEGGICGYGRRTGETLNIVNMAEDPRFIAAIDQPANTDPTTLSGNLLCLPILPDIPAPAIIRLYRHNNAFSRDEAASVAAVLQAVMEPLRRLWLLYANPTGMLQSIDLPALNNPAYRREALATFMSGDSDESPVLAQNDQLTQWTYWILLLGLFSLLAYLFLGRIHDYAAGPGVIRASDRSEINALSEGTVSDVLVSPGDRVEAGQAVLRLYQGKELAELQQLEEEFQARLRQRLLNPDDVQLEAVLINLRSELELARSRLAERTITAPSEGLIGDIRVRQGQYVGTGQALLTISHNDDRRNLVALIPGRYRPQLQPGMSIRMELTGYPFDYQNLTISSIDNQVIGPQQARLYLGAAIADGLTIEGPVVLVQAELPASFLSRSGAEYVYHDGMHGQVEIRLRSEPIIHRLMPGLKAIGAEHE